ncbi:MAG: response regulator [Candidatus Levybacteria bacterium]|nr:response regulator [Candidatus Levybacteria bacterium]MBI2420734.1 response regulator [Candidatus Levybacteria bacterium]
MKKILVIDDDEGILEAMRLTLVTAGYSVETLITDGKDIIKKVKNVSPDLVILDYLLSGQEGKNICKQLKSERSTGKIPILITSAHPNVEKLAVEAGADDFIEKPFDIDELLNKIKKNILL